MLDAWSFPLYKEAEDCKDIISHYDEKHDEISVEVDVLGCLISVVHFFKIREEIINELIIQGKGGGGLPKVKCGGLGSDQAYEIISR